MYGQRLDVWKAGKDSLVARIHGEGRAFETRVSQEALSRAQRELIVSITRNLERINPAQLTETTALSLSKVLDQGLQDPLVQAIMSRNYIKTQETDMLVRQGQTNMPDQLADILKNDLVVQNNLLQDLRSETLSFCQSPTGLSHRNIRLNAKRNKFSSNVDFLEKVPYCGLSYPMPLQGG